jgi:2-enoate reductase
MVMLGRSLLADPEWPNKTYAGRVDEIRPCIGCQEGCINEFVEAGHPQCAVNPRSGFESVTPELLPPAENKKRIAVVGAGPAGVLFAITAAKRGHQVELFEKTNKIGGKIISGSIPRIKYELANYLHYLEHVLTQAQSNYDLKLHLQTDATETMLKQAAVDAVVYAIGTKNASIPVPGFDEIPHVDATVLLESGNLPSGVKNVVVVGGGVVGCETAYWLSYEQGVNVKVVEMLPYFMHGTCTANRGHLIYYMKKNGVELLNATKVVGFGDKQVIVERNTHKNVPNPYNTWQPILPENIHNPLAPKVGIVPRTLELEADLVVLAVGGKPDDETYLSAQAAHVAPELYNIGDSFAAGRVLEATRAAYALASRI